MKSLFRWGTLLIGSISGLVGLGILYQNIAEKKDRRKFPPPGSLIAVGGSRLHYTCQGQGSPTVILEAGLSCTHLDWSYVLPEVAKITQVIAYDRGGYGWSDPCTKPRTGQKMATELHTLLKNAGVQGPFILVGHSFGSHIVRLFTSQYPDEVAGIILVDGSPEGQREHFQKSMPFRERFINEIQWQIYCLRPLLARIGILRLRKQPNGYINALPEEIKPIAIAIGLQSKAYDWVWSEAPFIDATNEEVKRSIIPDHIQSTILTAGKSIPTEEKNAIWITLQKTLASRMPNCTHSIVEESGHFIHLDKPEKVIEAICQMVYRGKHT